MKTKLFTIAMMVAFIMTAMTKVQAQNFEGPCLPQMHGMDGHQSALCGSTQAIALESGVNWVSFYVEADLATLKAALVDATPNMAISIQSQTQNANYNPSNQRWTGRLTSLDLAYMYKITVAEDCEIMLDGMRVNPSEHQLMIDGLTWIAYPFAEPMRSTTAAGGRVSLRRLSQAMDTCTRWQVKPDRSRSPQTRNNLLNNKDEERISLPKMGEERTPKMIVRRLVSSRRILVSTLTLFRLRCYYTEMFQNAILPLYL